MIACHVSSLTSWVPKPSICTTTATRRIDDDVGAIRQHVVAELVEHQQLLWQVVAEGQLGEPGAHPVDLVGGDLSDVVHVLLARGQSPFWVEGQADMRLSEELFVTLGLGEEVGVAGLQIENDIHAGCFRRIHPRSDVLERALR